MLPDPAELQGARRLVKEKQKRLSQVYSTSGEPIGEMRWMTDADGEKLTHGKLFTKMKLQCERRTTQGSCRAPFSPGRAPDRTESERHREHVPHREFTPPF